MSELVSWLGEVRMEAEQRLSEVEALSEECRTHERTAVLPFVMLIEKRFRQLVREVGYAEDLIGDVRAMLRDS